MEKIVRLTESDLTKIVRRVITENKKSKKKSKLDISDVINNFTLEDITKIVNAFTDINIPIEAVREEIELNYL